MRFSVLMPAFIATLLGVAACSHGPSGSAQGPPPATPAVSAVKPAAPPAVTPLPAPTSDERLAQALSHLGAKHGPRGEMLTLADDAFIRDHAKLQSSAAGELQQLATVLRDYPKAELIVEGYTDNRGSEHHNERFSLERADIVKQTLVTAGLDGNRISTRGLGAADPIGDNATKAGREENQRVELVFSNSDGKFTSTKDQSKTG